MTRKDFYASTALGLCLAAAPFGAWAQSGETASDPAAMFAPQVELCVRAPAAETCQQFYVEVRDCAAALDLVRCEALFDDAEAVFADPVQREQAQILLTQTSAAFDQLQVAESEPSLPLSPSETLRDEAPELIVEEAPVEEFIAPVDAAPTLDVAQQGELDRLMETPDIAAALSVLSGVPADAAAQPSATARAPRENTGRDTPVEQVEAEIAASDVRTSGDEFESGFALDFNADQARAEPNDDLQRAGLVALGALAVGMIINANRVVARSDERVIIQREDGDYEVWRDDDVILSEEGSQRRIERYADGSTRTEWERDDGTQIVTIRDATGRVLWRERILPDGTIVELVNDMREAEPVDVTVLPPARRRELLITERTNPELTLALLREAEADARALDRSFTLRQIREVREVRELLPILSPEPITFETNRASVRASEAPKLSQVGRLMERLLADNPRELFLIEGYTDATGPAAYNLALSDRRAESVALALSEFFDIPSENLIIQGYGERNLRIATGEADERNRRVAIRRISPLLGL